MISSVIKLWHFQTTAKEEIRKILRATRHLRIDNESFVLLVSPTGTGKTVTAASIVKDAVKKGSRVLFIVDRQNLVMQTSKEFTKYGIQHGIAMSHMTHSRNLPVQIASAQTLEARDFLYSTYRREDGTYEDIVPDLVIIDEAHEVRKKIIRWLRSLGVIVLGLTATPFARALGNIYSFMVSVITTNEAIRQKYLVPIRVAAPAIRIKHKGVGVISSGKNQGEWKAVEIGERTSAIIGDVVWEWRKHTEKVFGGPVPTVVFFRTVENCKDAARRFIEAGYKFKVIHGNHSIEEKETLIEDLKQGRLHGLITCNVLTKGFDYKGLLCIVDASPLRKSFSTYVQRIGRLMRASEGKEFGYVIDMCGNYVRFYERLKSFFASGWEGLDKQDWDAEQPASDKEQTRTETEITCSQCGLLLLPNNDICPGCGKERYRAQNQVEEIPGTTAEIDTVSGEEEFTGDYWQEICKYVNQHYPKKGLEARHSMAKAKFKDIRGAWPAWGVNYVTSTEPPDPFVADICRKRMAHYHIKNKFSRKKEHG